MSRQVYCQKLEKEAEGLKRQPYPGELGARIFDNISKEAWQSWLGHQTMLINEYRLSTLDEETQSFIETEMVKFLFTGGEKIPEGFTPKTK